MLGDPSWDSSDEIDPERVFTHHGIHRNGGACMPFTELGLQERNVRVPAAPLEVGPSREVDAPDELHRLRKRRTTSVFGGVGHDIRIPVDNQMRTLIQRGPGGCVLAPQAGASMLCPDAPLVRQTAVDSFVGAYSVERYRLAMVVRTGRSLSQLATASSVGTLGFFNVSVLSVNRLSSTYAASASCVQPRSRRG